MVRLRAVCPLAVASTVLLVWADGSGASNQAPDRCFVFRDDRVVDTAAPSFHCVRDLYSAVWEGLLKALSSSRLMNEHVECQPDSARAAHPNPLES